MRQSQHPGKIRKIRASSPSLNTYPVVTQLHRHWCPWFQFFWQFSESRANYRVRMFIFNLQTSQSLIVSSALTSYISPYANCNKLHKRIQSIFVSLKKTGKKNVLGSHLNKAMQIYTKTEKEANKDQLMISKFKHRQLPPKIPMESTSGTVSCVTLLVVLAL